MRAPARTRARSVAVCAAAALTAISLVLTTPSHAAGTTKPAPTKPAARACTFENPLTLKEARVLVGLKQRKARELARDTYKWGWRVGERDGEGFAVTTDYQPCRVTVAINNGRVTKILQVG